MLIELVVRRLLPSTPWRYCRSTRPKPWKTCTRVVRTWRFYINCVLWRTSRFERRRWPHSLWVVRCPVPSLAVSIWHEGAWEGTVPECSRVADRPLRRRCRELCPAVLGSTEADWGDQAHHAPEKTCCFHPDCSPSACSSPWAPPCGRPRSLSSLPPGSVVEPVAGRTPSPSRHPPNLAASASARGPETGDLEMEETAHQEMVTFVSFCFCSATQNFNKRAVSSVSGSQEEESCELCITGSLSSSSLTSGHQWVAQEHPSCPFVEPGKGCNTRVPASGHHTPGSHKPQTGFLRFLPQEEESGECYTSHPDPAPCHHRPGQAITGPGPGPCIPPRYPTAGTSVAPLVLLARSLGAWLALPSPSWWLLRTIRLGYAIQLRCCYFRPPRPRRGEVGGKAWSGRPSSLCSQSSWSLFLWKPYSWLHWPRSRGWGSCRHFWSMNRALSLGRLTPVQHWDPGPATCPRFLPLPSGTRWWTCKCCPWWRQTQP